MQSLSALSTALPLLVVLVGGVLGYFSGRLLDNRRQLVLQKGQAYADYLKALANAATAHPTAETLTLATDAKTRICIYGSPAVIH